MKSPQQRLVCDLFQGCSITSTEQIQSLWSGYGELLRIHLKGAPYTSVILKHIKLPQRSEHPRGWNSSLSHQRKLKSYQVECYWYQHYAERCTAFCPVPRCLALHQDNDEIYLLLSDLSEAGFSQVKSSISLSEVCECLSWLAHFHAIFLQQASDGLWQCGTYWHLDTRPEELNALDDLKLKQAAPLIDQVLKQCQFQTLVHGDAKLANFCFKPEHSVESKIAAVDFQYVGAGCGMKDVAYFLGSCVSDEQCKAQHESLLNHYFKVLSKAVGKNHPHINTESLVEEWREMFDFAWADFHRFLKGWSPGHWKLNSYSEQLSEKVLDRLFANKKHF